MRLWQVLPPVNAAIVADELSLEASCLFQKISDAPQDKAPLSSGPLSHARGLGLHTSVPLLLFDGRLVKRSLQHHDLKETRGYQKLSVFMLRAVPLLLL